MDRVRSLLPRKRLLEILGGTFAEVVGIALWYFVGLANWILPILIVSIGIALVLVYRYYPKDSPILPELTPETLSTIQEPSVNLQFAISASTPRTAALRGGYASILIHLYAFEYWLDKSRPTAAPMSREEFFKRNSFPGTNPFGREYTIKERLKREQEVSKDYETRMKVNRLMREFDLGITKMKASLEPAFKSSFPDELQEVVNMANEYIDEGKKLDKSTGNRGAFGFASATARTFIECRLVIDEINRLRKVFSRDESVMYLLNNLKAEYKFMMDRVREAARSKNAGFPY